MTRPRNQWCRTELEHCIYIYIYTHTFPLSFSYIYIYIYIYIHIYIYIYTYIHTYIYIYICIYIYIYITFKKKTNRLTGILSKQGAKRDLEILCSGQKYSKAVVPNPNKDAFRPPSLNFPVCVWAFL